MQYRRHLHRCILLSVLLSVAVAVPLMAEQTISLEPYFRRITLSGVTHPRKELTVTSEVSGRCTSVLADVGEAVPSSSTLAEIDPTFIELELATNEIARREARRRLVQEQKNLDRYTELRRRESTPEATFDQAALQVDVLALAVEKLEAERQLLQERLTRHTITAPPGWLVIERYTEPGEFVQVGSPIARVGDFENLLVRFAVTYDELASLEGNEAITLLLTDIDRSVSARIYQTSPVIDAATRKIPLELLITSPRAELGVALRGGMRAELSFTSTTFTNSFVVPPSALISRYEAHWLMRPDQTRVPVLLLGQTEDKSGVIVSGEALRAGMAVLAAPAAAGEPQ